MISAFVLNSLLVAAAILIHYEMLYRLSNIIPELTIRHRFRVVIGLFGAVLAHIVEVWLFALGYYFMINQEGYGSLTGNFNNTLNDRMFIAISPF